MTDEPKMPLFPLETEAESRALNVSCAVGYDSDERSYSVRVMIDNIATEERAESLASWMHDLMAASVEATKNLWMKDKKIHKLPAYTKKNMN